MPSEVPLAVTNNCSVAIWPGIATQAGSSPSLRGFELAAGASRKFNVATNWNGRIWARTNCTFDSAGAATCATGDCGASINCTGGNAPATLAEFNLPGYDNLSFYDISLVDGYNLPLAIQAIQADAGPAAAPPNQTNPSCVASIQDLAKNDFDPYANGQQTFLGTDASRPLPFEADVSASYVAAWCPYDLQQNPTRESGGKRCPCFAGSDVAHPAFNPCVSACSRYRTDAFCCAGKHDSAKKCKPNYYSKAVKRVCPDAYGFAYDDATSTFAVPKGSGFEVVFCPGGRSTSIRRTLAEGLNRTSAGVRSVVPSLIMVVAVLTCVLLLFSSW